MINLTDSAVNAVKTAISSAAQPASGLRIMVETGGCAGFKYMMGIAEEAKPDDKDKKKEGEEGKKKEGDAAVKRPEKPPIPPDPREGQSDTHPRAAGPHDTDCGHRRAAEGSDAPRAISSRGVQILVSWPVNALSTAGSLV